MQLNKVYIDGYKNLIKTSIEIQPTDIEDLSKLMDVNSPYSKAEECYIRCFRDRKWIEQLLFDKG